MRRLPAPHLFLPAILAVALISGCREKNRYAAPPELRTATLERALENQRSAETLVADVQAWIARATTDALPADRERVEALSTDLRLRLERLKPELGRTSDERTSDYSVKRDVADLSNAYNRAMASIASERRAAEDTIAKAIADLDVQLKGFRVDIASAGVQGNAEVKRRVVELDLTRREAADTLAELRRSGIDNWPALHRRWEFQSRQWNGKFQEANERLKKMPPPPAPTPKPAPVPRPAIVHH